MRRFLFISPLFLCGCRAITRRLIEVFVPVIALLFLTGCLVDAGKLAGFSNPKLIVKKTITGFYAEAGSDFNGHLVADYDPETNRFHIDGTVSSNVSGVVTAEGERADHLIELRKAEMNYLVESQRLVGENVKAVGQMLALAAVGGGEAVAKMVDAAAPILKGSTVTLPGGLGATLGGPVAPPVTP